MGTDLIYNHRANHFAPSIAIFNKDLATLVDALDNGSLPASDLDLASDSCRLAWKLCAASADVYNSESERMQELRPHLDGLLAGFFRETHYELPGKIGVPDAVIRLTPYSVLAWLEEWTPEVGLGGNAGIRIAVDYAKMVTQEQYKDICQRTCCLCVLVVFSGPLLQIYGAVFTEIATVQPIGEPIRLYGAPPHESRIARVAATFGALRTALAELETYYTTAMNAGSPDTVLPSRLFPSPTPAEELDSSQLGILNDLKFTGYLDYDGRKSSDYSRALYTGTLRQQHVVIKFCNRYGHEAHTVLGESGLAPRMHLCINVRGGLKMIVMDHLERPWQNLASAFIGQPAIPAETRDAVRSALMRLHDTGFAFGDVRRVNIFVHTDAKKIMLADFEFSGRDVHYPLGLNTSSIRWVEGVEPGSKILKEHDIGMCDKL
ncbi:hypothetical protein OE88DRAFT_1697247 [Heliocybe sulcata]|uniref:Protein kinase domain-containing protein n=1 Tax=Heliocybe sulcata TaxID=5364 RepID=A0A5C3N642_9AGAM|nr:hypothetical protein OE88DRAFT_1697247 [Heliocybe sulcata]